MHSYGVLVYSWIPTITTKDCHGNWIVCHTYWNWTVYTPIMASCNTSMAQYDTLGLNYTMELHNIVQCWLSWHCKMCVIGPLPVCTQSNFNNIATQTVYTYTVNYIPTVLHKLGKNKAYQSSWIPLRVHVHHMHDCNSCRKDHTQEKEMLSLFRAQSWNSIIMIHPVRYNVQVQHKFKSIEIFTIMNNNIIIHISVYTWHDRSKKKNKNNKHHLSAKHR